MKSNKFISLAILVIILVSVCLSPVAHATDKPLSYQINAPNIIHVPKKKHTIEIQWYQVQRTLVVVYKLSETRHTFDDCGWIGDNYKTNYCKIIFTRRNLVGNMRIRDKDYRAGDTYYLLEYKYPTHNGAYGPFEP
jgi:hypothetical protein